MRDEIQAFKRERILQEAVSLFYERGFTGTTLDDIAHQLGVTKPFIYTHFRSKTDLLAAICVPMIEKVVAIGMQGGRKQRLPQGTAARADRRIHEHRAGAAGEHHNLFS